MKGYSFQELVKLAEAAVKRAGDTMTGDLTAPKFLMSAAQSTAVNASTRKDYVDSAIAAGDALQVSKSGDTMSGNLTTPKVLVSGAQGTEVNALTRRDYVTAELAKKLNLTGGTLTGNLTAPAVLVSATQNTSANALTRKDYVDTALNAKLNTAGGSVSGPLYVNTVMSDVTGLQTIHPHAENSAGIYWGNTDQWSRVLAKDGIFQVTNGTSIWRVYHYGYRPTPAEIGAVSKTGDTMTGNLIVPAVLMSAVQQTREDSATRKDYVDGQIAKQVSKAGDTMTGNLTAPTVWVSSAQNASASALTRKDYVDAQVATRAPSSHTHNSSEITGGSTAILTGTIASGGTIPLPSGYTEAQCKWIAAGGNMQDPGNDMSSWRITTSGRVVTVLVDGTVVSGNYANYMIIGVK